MMRTLFVKFIALPLVGLVAFVVFLLALFPEEHARNLVTRNVEKSLDYQYRVEMVEFDLGLFGGLDMKSVTLTPRFEFEQVIPQGQMMASAAPIGAGGVGDAPSDKAPDDAPQYFCPDQIDPMPVMIEAISVDPSLLGLLTGNLSGDFAVKVAGGTINGTAGSDAFAAEIDDVVLQRFALLRNILEMHTIGRLGAKVDLELDDEGRLSGGNIAMDLSDAVICPKKFKVADPRVPFIELPLTRLGDVSGEISISDSRRLEFKDFKGDGEDLALEITGHIQLATPQRPNAFYDLRIRITPSPAWEQELVVLDTICQKGPDGSYQIVISGDSGQLKKDCVRNRGGGAAAMPQARQQTRVSPPPPAPPPTHDDGFADDDGSQYVIEEEIGSHEVGDDSYVIEDSAPAIVKPRTPRGGAGSTIKRGPTAAELRSRGVKPMPVEANKQLLKNAYGPR